MRPPRAIRWHADRPFGGAGGHAGHRQASPRSACRGGGFQGAGSVRLRRCAGVRVGRSAVEADNPDSYTRSGGRLTESQALAFATLLTARAHRSGLAIGQKNGADLAAAGKRTVGFDFAVVEECQVYDECAAYTDVYGRQVYEIEYTDNGRSAYAEACAAQGRSISVTLRDRDVVPRGAAGYVNRHC
ncbi:hypothetical protein C5C27_04185 [Rathayibacter sp. AY2B7]|nr:hypothetical protein C5C27_04185 [Rathayibacter sp. AY2B7]